MPSISLISVDVDRTETITQMADALDGLRLISESIFNRIDERLNRCNRRLESIDTRLVSMHTKVQHVRSIKNAVAVFAPAKYPTLIRYRNDQRLFREDEQRNDQRVMRTSVDRRKVVANTMCIDVQAIIEEKMKFFHVNVRTDRERASTTRQGITMILIRYSSKVDG